MAHALHVTQSVVALVVDDETVIRRVLCEALVDEGYRVIEARNGHEALEYWRRERPHVVLLDLMMPSPDGWTILAARAGDPVLQAAKVVALSASSLDGLVRARALGADAVLGKPFDLDEVVQVAQSVAASNVTAQASTTQ